MYIVQLKVFNMMFQDTLWIEENIWWSQHIGLKTHNWIICNTNYDWTMSKLKQIPDSNKQRQPILLCHLSIICICYPRFLSNSCELICTIQTNINTTSYSQCSVSTMLNYWLRWREYSVLFTWVEVLVRDLNRC